MSPDLMDINLPRQSGTHPGHSHLPLLEHLYPEIQAGGYCRVDGTIEFYARINALLSPDMTVMDFGAGRGGPSIDDPSPYRKALRNFQGKTSTVIGIDVDPAVLSNPTLDEAIVWDSTRPIPLPNASVDLIFADYCFEHIDEPGRIAPELTRVLKSGGWLCARTPNRWGYIGVSARIVPNASHARFLRVVQPQRKVIDVFPTAYRLNTRRAIREHFPESTYRDYTYYWNGPPSYCGNAIRAARAMKLVTKHLPEALWPVLLVFLRKR